MLTGCSAIVQVHQGKMGIEKAQQMGLARSALNAAYVNRALDGVTAIKENAQTREVAFNAAALAEEIEKKAVYAYGDYLDKSIAYAQTRATAAAMKDKWDDPISGRLMVEGEGSADDIGMLYRQWKEARVMEKGPLYDSTFPSKVSEWGGRLGALCPTALPPC